MERRSEAESRFTDYNLAVICYAARIVRLTRSGMTANSYNVTGHDQRCPVRNCVCVDPRRSSAYIINASRGGTVDTEALVEALRNDTIAGAGLDVIEGEPGKSTHPPHSGKSQGGKIRSIRFDVVDHVEMADHVSAIMLLLVL